MIRWMLLTALLFPLVAMPGIGLSTTAAVAADAPNPKTAFLSALDAGPDFADQGEYEGVIGEKTKLGVQVVALGDGKFEARLLAKGLPGAGWDGKTVVPLTGERIDGVVKLAGKDFTAEIRDGVVSGRGESGVPFRARKVERVSSTLGAEPPAGAVVLFDGSNVDAWAKATLEDGGLLGVGTRTKEPFGDFTLHLEFRTPFMPFARGQARGNSGLYLADQYEVQVLDSFGLAGRDNECGGIYKAAGPKVNMCLPPLSWQTYDVEFTAAKFDEAGKKTADAVATIRHNGVLIHDALVLKAPTPGGGRSDEKPGPIFLQNHGDPVRFRNVWIVKK